MKDLLKDYGMAILDTRDFFSQSFVEKYKKTIIEARKEFKLKLDVCTTTLPYNDGCPAWTSTFMEYMNERLDKDYSYLYDGTYFHKDTDKWWPQIDHNFTMDCFEYFDKQGIDVNELTNEDIPSLSSLSQGFYHQCAYDFAYPKGVIKDWLLQNDEITIKMMNSFSEEKLPYEVGEWLQLGDEESYKVVRDDGYTDYVDQGKWKNEKRHKHLNVFYEKSFMPLHTDQQDDSNVHYICQTYPNIDRTLEDGSVLRYWIDKERFDLVTNYNTVVIFDIRKGAGAIPHLVTRNNVDKVRYSSYEVWRD
mgnify:CR=1 FL=1